MKQFLLLSILACLPAQAQRAVFAHYMLANQDYVSVDAPAEAIIASYQREIRQAQAIGIDGFALNAGGWFKEPRYIRRASYMFEAAYRLNSGFKLMFSADMCCSNSAEDVEDMVRRFANNPRYAGVYYRRDGRFLLTTFAGEAKGPAFWNGLRRDLETGTNPSQRGAPEALGYAGGTPSSKPLPIALVTAFFWGGETPEKTQIQAGLPAYQDIIDGSFYWGIAGVPNLGHTPDQIPSGTAYGDVLHSAHKLYMAPVCLQFWGANAGRYYEYSGFAGMRAMWQNAIASRADLVEMITWNDFVEGTYVSPIDDPAAYPGANELGASAAPPETRNFFHSHAGADGLLAWFIRWYKTGLEPVGRRASRRDEVFWAYRTVIDVAPNEGKPVKMYGPTVDKLYVTANLTAPAVIAVSVGGQRREISMPAGSHDVEVPLLAGPAPTLALIRGTQSGVALVSASGTDAIVKSAAMRNLYYSTGSMHD